MKILVVCGAGASSTFVAQRVRHAAHARGLNVTAIAGTELSLPIDLDDADIVLVGPQLAHAMERIEKDAAYRGTRVVILPADVFTDLDGSRTLALIQDSLDANTAAEKTPTQSLSRGSFHDRSITNCPDRIVQRTPRATREALCAGGEGRRAFPSPFRRAPAAPSTPRAFSA